jgi:hypothetical protein
MSLTASSGKSMLLRARFRTKDRRRCRVVEEDFHLSDKLNTLMTSS